MNRIKKLFPAVFLMLTLIFCGVQIAEYHQNAYAETTAAENHSAAEGHHGPPVTYFLYWLLLIFCFYRVAQFLKAHNESVKEQNARRMAELGGHSAAEEHSAHDDGHGEDHGGAHHHPQPTSLDKLLVLLVLAMFLLEQNEALAHFHEYNILGFMKFLLKAGLGVSLMTYGILGMGEH